MFPVLAAVGVVLDAVIIGLDLFISDPGTSQLEVFGSFSYGTDFSTFLSQTWLIWVFLMGLFWLFVAVVSGPRSGKRCRR